MITKIKLIFSTKAVTDETSTIFPQRAMYEVVSSVSEPASANFVRFSIKEQVLFAKRLAFLSKAGVSILESVTIIRNQTKSKRKRRILDTVVADVAAGQSLSRSLERYKQLFGEFTVNLIRIGETAGVLPENLMYLAEELSKKQALQRKVQGALIYPIFITIATLGVTGMLIVFIFPKIMPIFISLNVSLPWTTRVLLNVSEFLSQYGFVTLLGTIFIIIAVELARIAFRPLRIAADWLLLKLPIAGGIASSYNCANFCRTVALNIKSGVALSESLHITADVTKNTLYRDAYLDFAAHVMKGEKISTTMAKYPNIFPDMLPHMILIGETTGSLSNTLTYLSDLYEAEVEESTRNLSNSIEPILLMTMGIMVGTIAVSVIAPIYEVTKSIGNAR
jgi:type II secretory pathway component PulF